MEIAFILLVLAVIVLIAQTFMQSKKIIRLESELEDPFFIKTRYHHFFPSRPMKKIWKVIVPSLTDHRNIDNIINEMNKDEWHLDRLEDGILVFERYVSVFKPGGITSESKSGECVITPEQMDVLKKVVEEQVDEKTTVHIKGEDILKGTYPKKEDFVRRNKDNS